MLSRKELTMMNSLPLSNILLFIDMVEQLDLELIQMNVKITCLHGDFKEDINMKIYIYMT